MQDPSLAKISLNEIQGYDFRELLKAPDVLANGYIVEGVNVGRGDYWKDPIELRSVLSLFPFSCTSTRLILPCCFRAHNVITTGVKFWPVFDGELKPCLEECNDHIGLFRDDEIYIIRWSFYSEITGVK